MKNIFKTILLTLHTQILISTLFFVMLWMGVKVPVFHELTLMNTFIFAWVLMIPYFILTLSLGLFRRRILALPYKSLSLLILLVLLFSLSFGLSQQDIGYWRIYFLGHLPVGYFIRSWLPSQFDWTQQFLIGLSALTPALATKFAYELSGWIVIKTKKIGR